MQFKLRLATTADRQRIEQLIATSSRGLGLQDYSPQQIEYALETAWGLDQQLIADQSYFLVENTSGMLIGCGGWSFRETLFGNDAEQNRSAKIIDPATSAAKIRAFFIHPNYARLGLGSLLMCHCEQEAIDRGYTSLELMATLPGQRLYEQHGFIAGEPIAYPLRDSLSIEFVPMRKTLREP